MRLDEITRMVLEVSPQLVDPREASAIVCIPAAKVFDNG